MAAQKNVSNNSTTSEKFPKWRTSNYEKKFRNRKQIYFFYFPLKKNYLISKKKIKQKNGRPKKFSKQFYKNLTTPAMDKCCINMNKTVRVTYNKLLTRTLS